MKNRTEPTLYGTHNRGIVIPMAGWHSPPPPLPPTSPSVISQVILMLSLHFQQTLQYKYWCSEFWSSLFLYKLVTTYLIPNDSTQHYVIVPHGKYVVYL
jgi:hypothetical protein